MKILIPHSWSPNVGDMALLKTSIRWMREIVPKSEITALVSDPQFTRKKCPELDIKLERWPWPVKKKSRFDILMYPFVYTSHILSVLVFRFLGKKFFLFNREFEKPLIEFFNCDVLISPGGDFISPKYGFVTTFSEFLFAKILKKKIIILPQTFGPFEGLLNGNFASLFLNMADLIFVREEKSARLLKEIGVKKAKLTADIVFTYSQPEKTKREKRVIFCAENVKSKRYASQMIELSKKIAKSGFQVVFMPANGADIAINKDLAEKSNAQSIEIVQNPDKVAALVAESEFIISSRMHPLVLGTLSGTPFFAIGNTFKFKEVLGDFAKDSWSRVDEIDIEKIMGKIEKRNEIGRLISENFKRVRQRSEKTKEMIREEIRSW
jgi:polysaccharide pyruvyl transferase WcaK-like protein